MSTSTWDDRPSPAQMSPRGSYHPDCNSSDGSNYGRAGKGDEYEPDGSNANHYDTERRYGSDHGSVKNFDDDQTKKYDSGGCYSNHGSDHGSIKGYGSNHGSLKDFANDHGSGRKYGYGSDYGSAKNDHGDTKDSGSEYGQQYGEHGGTEAPHESRVRDSWRPGMSWIDRRTFYIGEACASPPDWANHPILRQVQDQDHQAYRQNRLEEWLSAAHKRHTNEKFGAYTWRASALANSELKQRKKQCFGDEYTNPVDKFVMRLFYGMKLRLERSESVILGVEEETFVLEILREECEDLYKNGQLYANQRSIQYTPLITSELNSGQERPHMHY